MQCIVVLALGVLSGCNCTLDWPCYHPTSLLFLTIACSFSIPSIIYTKLQFISSTFAIDFADPSNLKI